MGSMPLANIFGVEQWMLVAGVVLLLFGGNKIPELMRGLGRGVGELQKGLEDGKKLLHDSINAEPTVEAPKVPSEPALEAKPTEPAVLAAKTEEAPVAPSHGS